MTTARVFLVLLLGATGLSPCQHVRWDDWIAWPGQGGRLVESEWTGLSLVTSSMSWAGSYLMRPQSCMYLAEPNTFRIRPRHFHCWSVSQYSNSATYGGDGRTAELQRNAHQIWWFWRTAPPHGSDNTKSTMGSSIGMDHELLRASRSRCI